MAPKMRGNARDKSKDTARKKRATVPERNEEEEQILLKAQHYMMFEAQRPMLWTVAGIREERTVDGS